MQDSNQFNGPPVCTRCNKHIYDGTIFQVRSQFWHNSCAQCVVCRQQLTGCCHLKDNELYCRNDFARLFGAKCSGCNEIISPSEGVHVASSNLYHAACFTCSMCNILLHAGDYFYLKDDGKLFCSSDYQRLLSEDRADTDSESDESGSDDLDQRNRMCFSDNQLRMLTETYQSNKRPSKHERRRLSQQTGLKPRTIQIWFQNRRAKDKSLTKNRRKELCNEISSGGANLTSADVNRNNRLFPQQQMFSDQMPISEHQLFCPLDFLVPNEMPPNVDLSTVDLCNGEVISGKQTSTGYDAQLPHQLDSFFSGGAVQWLTV